MNLFKKITLLLPLLVSTSIMNAQTVPLYEAEPNATPATATALTGTNIKIRGDIYVALEEDYYSFTANAGDKLFAATMSAFSANGSTDTHLTLYAADGTTVIEQDDNDGILGASAASLAGVSLTATGTYYLKVRGGGSTILIRPYDLYVSIVSGSSAVTEVEPNDVTAQSISPDALVSGVVDPAADIDQYSLTLNAGETVFISLDMDPERDNVFWNGRLLFGSIGGTNLVANDASAGAVGNPNSEAFFVTAKTTGVYTITVDPSTAGTGSSTSTYLLNTHVFAPNTGYVNYAAVTGLPSVIPTGPAVITSTITITDVKKIQDLRVNLNLTHTNMVDLDVILQSPDGNLVHLFSDIGSATFPNMDVTLSDYAGFPLNSYTIQNGLVSQPEFTSRLDLFRGMDIAGTWTLYIYDDLASNGGTLNSWSLDVLEDVGPDLTGLTAVYSNDFESNDGGFTHSGTQDEWELGTPTAAPITSAHSGVNCWKTDLDNTYNASASQDLYSPNIDLTTAGASLPAILSMYLKYQMESASFDHFVITVEEVGGSGQIQTLYTWTGATMNLNIGNPATPVQLSGGWGLYYWDISAFKGKIIRIHLHLDTDTSVQLGGIAVDDVNVYMGTCVPFTSVLSGDNSICASNSTDLQVAITGGASPYTVVYSDGTSNFTVNSYSSGSNIPVSPSSTQTYSLVSVTDANTCLGTGNSGTATVTVNNGSSSAILSGDNSICASSSTDLQVAITGGASPYTVVYSDGTSNFTVNSYSSGSNISVSPSSTQTYSLVSVTDANTCLGTGNSGTATVNVNASPSAALSGTATLCPGSSSDLGLEINNGTAPYDVVYSDGTSNFTLSGVPATQSIPQTPSVTTTYNLVSVTDANSCTAAPVDMTGTPTLTIRPAFNIPSAASSTLTADGSCVVGPWTHYFDDATNTIILSIKKNGNNIGDIGDGTFRVEAGLTPNFGSNTGTQISAPYVTNPEGWYVMNRFWQVTPNPQPSSDVDIRTYFNSQDVADVNGSLTPDVGLTGLTFYKINGVGDPNPANGHAGINQAPAYNSVGYWQYNHGATASDITWRLDSLSSGNYFAEYTVASFSGGGGGSGSGGTGAFPVEWLDFSAQVQDETVNLAWTVAQEQNNAYFTLLRSVDNNVYEQLQTVNSIGNHADAYTYQAQDLNPVQGISYYQIKQTDLDGKSSLSRIQTVFMDGKNSFSIYPNPNKGNFTLNLEGDSRSGEILLTNALGQVVHSEVLTDFIGEKELNLAGLAQGVYALTLKEKGNKVTTLKVVVE